MKCEYCGKVRNDELKYKAELTSEESMEIDQFDDWIVLSVKGIVSCPECHNKGEQEGQEKFNKEEENA